MQLTGAQIVWEVIVREGVDLVFGYPGGANLPIYDAMVQYPVRHILVRHEQCAAHMADGYARATGKVGVCMSTSGPGATNLVTGLATALLDSVPLVAVTGQVPTHLLGGDAFQETDVAGVTMPVTKHNYLVTDVRELAQVMREAFYIAREGRPGPVLVDICKDVQNARPNSSTPKNRAAQHVTTPAGREPGRSSGGGDHQSGGTAVDIRRPRGADGAGRSGTVDPDRKGRNPHGDNAARHWRPARSSPLVPGHGRHARRGGHQSRRTEPDVLIAIGMRFDDRITGR